MAIVVVAVVDVVDAVVTAMAQAAVAALLTAVHYRNFCLTFLELYPFPRKMLDWTSLYVLREALPADKL
jgi:hypothetical protein